MNGLSVQRVRRLLKTGRSRRIAVIGDSMVDQFIWGAVRRISPEAPVPIVEFAEESFMPGGAANVARNLSALGAGVELFGVVGNDAGARRLRDLLKSHGINGGGLTSEAGRQTGLKTRIIAHQQQVVRLDRETPSPIGPRTESRLLSAIEKRLNEIDGVIVGDYGKGVVTQSLLDKLKERCASRSIWLSLDPKPTHALNLEGLSLITPNRSEAFELAGRRDSPRSAAPLSDSALLEVAQSLLERFRPALLLITLGDQGMLLCRRGFQPFHIPTVAQEVFDVSGAGDTVIASFTLAVACGASPLEAAVFSNHAAGVVVGKIGTALVMPDELAASFAPPNPVPAAPQKSVP